MNMNAVCMNSRLIIYEEVFMKSISKIVKRLLLLFGIFVLEQIATIPSFFAADEAKTMTGILIGVGLTVLLSALFIHYSWPQQLWPSLKNIDWKAVGVAFLIILAFQVLFGVLADLWHIPTNENQKLVMDELRKTYYLAAVIDIVMAPIMEEIIFRFKFFEYFGEFMSKWVGIIVNGILFMVIHSTDLNVVTLVYFVIGAVLAYVYRRRNNLGDSIAVHMLNNAYAILL